MRNLNLMDQEKKVEANYNQRRKRSRWRALSSSCLSLAMSRYQWYFRLVSRTFTIPLPSPPNTAVTNC
jgi:hypothetical protein